MTDLSQPAPGHDSVTSVSLLARVGSNPADHEAWREFAVRYAPKIFRWCRAWGIGQEDAEDVTQAVLLKLSRLMTRFVYDPSGSFRAWLRTLVNHACGEFGMESRRADLGSGDSRVIELLSNVSARDDLYRRLEEEFDIELMEEAVRRVRLRVAPSTWEAYRLTAIVGLSGAEAAKQLGMKVANVFVAKSNVLKRIQEEVKLLEGP